MDGLPDGPVHFHYPAPALATDLLCARRRLACHAGSRLPRLGRGWVWHALAAAWGAAHLLLAGHPARAAARCCARPRLLLAQIYNVGVLSVLIIGVSGLFVGMVLGLQGYYVLSQFGAEESLGVMVAASLVRELGPVVTALLVAGRAGSALTAEIGLMKATEQFSGLEMMAVDPVRRILTPRFFGGLIAMPLLAAMFSAVGVLGGYFVGVGLLGVDDGAFWSQMQAKIDFRRGHGQRRHQEPGLRCGGDLDRPVPGPRRHPHLRGREPRHDPHRGAFRPGGARARFRSDGPDVWRLNAMAKQRSIEILVGAFMAAGLRRPVLSGHAGQ